MTEERPLSELSKEESLCFLKIIIASSTKLIFNTGEFIFHKFCKQLKFFF